MPEFDNQLTYLLQQAATYGQLFKTNDDEDRFKKTELFAEKLINKEYTIGYAGHFSAGKSSMINALTGVDLIAVKSDSNKCKYRKSKKKLTQTMQLFISRMELQ